VRERERERERKRKRERERESERERKRESERERYASRDTLQDTLHLRTLHSRNYCAVSCILIVQFETLFKTRRTCES